MKLATIIATVTVLVWVIVDASTASRLMEQAHAVAVVRNHVLVGYGSRLTINDISEPLSPIEIDSLTMPNDIRKIVVVGNTAYVAWINGLSSIDISEPASMQILDVYTGDAADIVVDSHYLFVVTLQYQLKIVDISNPSNLIEIGSYKLLPTPSVSIHDIVVQNDVVSLLSREPKTIKYHHQRWWLVDYAPRRCALTMLLVE